MIESYDTTTVRASTPMLIMSNYIRDNTDIKVILGNPSTISKFDNDVWIFIERKQTQSKIKNLGKMEIFTNNVLVLELDNYGILKKKDFYNKDDMEKIEIVESHTQNKYRKDTFIYNFLSSVRQRVNDPLGKRVKKRKEISQR